MRVKLLSRTSDMLKVIYVAARTCYSAKSPVDMSEDDFDETKMINLLAKVAGSGHTSVLEHGSFTFVIDGISRACTHQLVRHRHMSFSQKSQRYVNEGSFEYVIPSAIKNNPELLEKFEAHQKATNELYNYFVEAGVKKEDARSILPNATTSSITTSLNLRELALLAELRLCTRAQAEIRTLVRMMVNEVVKVEPWTKPYLQCKCDKLGFCLEENCCGKHEKLTPNK